MDDSQLGIGAWTRRRFSQLAGGLSLVLLGLGVADEGDARRKRRRNKRNDRHRGHDRDKDKDRERRRRKKRRKKRNRCIKVSKSCSQTGTSCCNSLICEDFGRPTNFRCCRPAGGGCSTNRDDECCPGLSCINDVCDFGP